MDSPNEGMNRLICYLRIMYSDSLYYTVVEVLLNITVM